MRADPEEWAAAVALEKQINESDPAGDGLYLHSSRKPLAMADLTVDDAMPLFRQCKDANCFT